MTDPPEHLEGEREREAWLAGFAAARDLLDRGLADAEKALSEGSREGVCDKCGSELIHSLGGGERCPECDL